MPTSNAWCCRSPIGRRGGGSGRALDQHPGARRPPARRTAQRGTRHPGRRHQRRSRRRGRRGLVGRGRLVSTTSSCSRWAPGSRAHTWRTDRSSPERTARPANSDTSRSNPTAASARADAAAAWRPSSARPALRRAWAAVGGKGGPEGLLAASSSGDAVATAIVERASSALAEAILTLCALVDPGCIVIGGGLAQAPHQLVTLAARYVGERASFHRVPPIVPATLGEWAGANGAVLTAPPPPARPRLTRRIPRARRIPPSARVLAERTACLRRQPVHSATSRALGNGGQAGRMQAGRMPRTLA